jgi:AraC-like DNA-binding protein
MKPFVQKLPLPENSSFLAATYRTPHFEVGWHQHEEYELILFTEGSGLSFIGKQAGDVSQAVGSFKPGDIYFLGSNLPHTFQKHGDQVTSAVVVQFKEDCWGRTFLTMPECRNIKQLLELAACGLMITGDTRYQLQPLIKTLETANDGNRIILLLQCLQIMASAKEYVMVSTPDIMEYNNDDKECIERIFKYTNDTFRDQICLRKVASVACMSVPSFCHYFKRHTQKTYINYLNEVRIGHACNLLLQTNKPVTEICYESGYSTITHFHRQFLRLKRITPLQYRKRYTTCNYVTEQTLARAGLPAVALAKAG